MHEASGLSVQRPERLVHQQDARPQCQRPGNSDALLHPAGELERITPREVRQPYDVEEAAGHIRPLLFRQVAKPELDVFQGRKPWVQRVLLENHASVPTRPLQGRVVEGQAPGARRLEPGDNAEEGGLTAPRRSYHGQELAVGQGQVDVVERLYRPFSGLESLFDIGEHQTGRHG